MTKHRKKEEWIEEILDAAAAQIEEGGYPNLTMESIAARTTLSKGGVYRYFANKRDVALALFRRLYTHTIDFDMDEAVGWNQPPHETIYRLLVLRREPNEVRQDHRIWVQLIPETLWDDGFREERVRQFAALQDKYVELVRRIIQRDGIEVPTDFEQRLNRYVNMGLILKEGMTIQSTLGTPLQEQADTYRRFAEVSLREMLGDKT
jgi:AcrR family transcriptional regulator